MYRFADSVRSRRIEECRGYSTSESTQHLFCADDWAKCTSVPVEYVVVEIAEGLVAVAAMRAVVSFRKMSVQLFLGDPFAAFRAEP